MSRIKDFMETRESEADLTNFLTQLLEREELKGALIGIAKQVASKGPNSMSPKQKNIVDNFVAKYKERHECDRCNRSNMINLTDYIFVSENSFNLCPMCDYDREKYMQE